MKSQQKRTIYAKHFKKEFAGKYMAELILGLQSVAGKTQQL